MGDISPAPSQLESQKRRQEGTHVKLPEPPSDHPTQAYHKPSFLHEHYERAASPHGPGPATPARQLVSGASLRGPLSLVWGIVIENAPWHGRILARRLVVVLRAIENHLPS